MLYQYRQKWGMICDDIHEDIEDIEDIDGND